eukprot:Blabericola_migrator_1__1971@NODE_1538_length_4323_cov_95_575893_g1011_i0_p1_GENE_NODE_1538_length_4323_cov_95_575893_g1011_i0NODE_1538_length_4323_cov_95_575893_g1011_i0_p1_ORF_typecomplete_len446_score64_61DNA_ligase_A_M/PF01068_21/2_4e38DNA_ligase_A_C/PF04679_15/2_8e14mRNA_cap_enzyme/PF01331_19/0_00019_NODE_1538_length_4323_cov_95_575893_g1011_i09702307
MEPKLDGERLLCHLVRICTDDITETKVVFFSRRGDSEYPSAYIPHFTDVLEKSIQVDEVILDGELLVWNRLTEALLPFGSARSAGAGKIDNADLFYVVFDVLHVKSHGQSHDVLALPLLKRRELLKRVITYEEPHHLEIVKSTEITKPEEIHEALEKVVIERGEGIMLKREDSQYMLGSRDAGWYKMKPEFGWLDDSLDLVVVGCFLSDGVRRRAHHSADPIDHISTFLLGILSDDKESILTFTKVGTGYTFEELREMVDMLRPYLMPLEAKDPLPEWTPNWTPNVSTRPDFILDHFSHGFVMEVIGAEIVESDVFGYGKTLRFPRAARGGAIRRDKDWADAETLTTIQARVQAAHSALIQAYRLFCLAPQRAHRNVNEAETVLMRSTVPLDDRLGKQQLPRFDPDRIYIWTLAGHTTMPSTMILPRLKTLSSRSNTYWSFPSLS